MADAAFTGLLSSLGFNKARVKRTWWGTTILYKGNGVGVEVELDWRDVGVFVLLVHLENGKQPAGYYMHEGKRVRVHIEDVLGRPPVDRSLQTQGDKLKRTKYRTAEETSGYLQQWIDYYARLLEAKGSLMAAAARTFFAS